MRRSQWRIGALLAAGVLALAVAAAALGTTTRSGSAKAEGGSLTVWLSGTYAGATPGSSYRKWLDGVKARYEKAYPGSKVKFVLTPINNAQFTAQIAAAFASKKVPDAMLVIMITAALGVLYVMRPGLGEKPRIDEMLITEPDFCGSMIRPAARMQ